MTISRSKWERAFLLTHKLSISNRHQERNYKILARWYRCPVDMHKIKRENEEVCWRCQNAKGTMSDIWYYCLEVQICWSKIYNIQQAITGQSAQPDVFVSVLSMIPGSMKAIRKDILRYMLTAARTVIARKWNKTVDPSIEEWMCEMSKMQSMELMIVTETGLKKQTLKAWQKWEEFITSAILSDYLQSNIAMPFCFEMFPSPLYFCLLVCLFVCHGNDCNVCFCFKTRVIGEIIATNTELYT